MPKNVFDEIKESANGMLSPEVYRKIFDLARNGNGGAIVEIGTAHGAATIASALGAIEGGKPFHIYTVDPFQGKYSSRSKFGGVQDNISIVRSHFRKFGVDDHITIIAGEIGDLDLRNVKEGINILLLDADGRLDRDLALLYRYLTPDSSVIIDDIDDAVYMTKAAGVWRIDQKHRISFLLTNQLSSKGILRDLGSIYNTGFFQKGPINVSGEEIERIALPLYRELVFAEITHPPSGSIQGVKDWVRRNIPFARSTYQQAKTLLSKSRT